MGACAHDHGGERPSAAALKRKLAAAEAAAVARGERMTPPRARVLKLLLEAGQPVKAYDLIARYGDDGRPAKPPTVYRALEFLERQGLAHRIASISAYVACADEGDEGDAHAAAFLICDCCGDAREVHAHVDRAMDHAAADAGYVIQRTTIEAHGLCRSCRG